LGEVWRSAGWPCRDAIELDLLGAGLLDRQWDDQGRETLRVTDAGIAVLAATRERNRALFAAHESLVERVSRDMRRSGRVVWRGLRLRVPLPAEQGGSNWVTAMPDVFSIRHTTVEDHTEPIAHEIKVSRADLLSDLRRATKAAAYLAMAGQCWYVIRRGIAQAEEIPPEYGVMLADDHGLEVARSAPRRPMRLPFPVWMALARANAEHEADDEAQAQLGLGHPVEKKPG
jgi:hypothetical protein